MKPFFSIVIPVYNVEPYIARCLDSCINQTFKDIEIIIVDDCGNDNSIQIAKTYIKQDKRIKIINNFKNFGTFTSRIEGAKKTQGQYILFLDSDDWIDLHTCEILYNHIMQDFQTTNQWSDIIQFGMDFYPKTFKHKKPIIITQELHNQEIIKKYLLEPITPPWSICGKLYKTTLMQKVICFIQNNLPNFPKLTMAEDALQFFIITLFAKKSTGINQNLYTYFASETSITRKTDVITRDKKVNDLQIVISFLDLIIQKMPPHITNKIFFDTKNKLQRHIQSIIKLEYRYDATAFAYPISCIKSLKYYCTWKTPVRILIYCLTFGKIKL